MRPELPLREAEARALYPRKRRNLWSGSFPQSAPDPEASLAHLPGPHTCSGDEREVPLPSVRKASVASMPKSEKDTPRNHRPTRLRNKK